MLKILDFTAPEKRGITEEEFIQLKIGDTIYRPHFNDNIPDNPASLEEITILGNFYNRSPNDPPAWAEKGAWRVKVSTKYSPDQEPYVNVSFVKDIIFYGWGKAAFYTKEEAEAWLADCQAAWDSAPEYQVYQKEKLKAEDEAFNTYFDSEPEHDYEYEYNYEEGERRYTDVD